MLALFAPPCRLANADFRAPSRPSGWRSVGRSSAGSRHRSSFLPSALSRARRVSGSSSAAVAFRAGRGFRALALLRPSSPNTALQGDASPAAQARAPELERSRHACGGLSNSRWSLAGLTPSATVRRLPPLDRLGSAPSVRLKNRRIE